MTISRDLNVQKSRGNRCLSILKAMPAQTVRLWKQKCGLILVFFSVLATILSLFPFTLMTEPALPENEWITSAIDGKLKKTIGKVNEDLEISNFKTNALPLYVITDHEGKALNKPMPTNLNIEEYKEWLDEGVKIFKAKPFN